MNTLVIPDNLNPELTVNYGTSGGPACSNPGDPANAAAWVTYANQTKHYGVKWWEVGNEVYETGEPDSHANPHTPESYANFEPAFYSAMKEADPSINIGVPITAGSHNKPTWDAYVLQNAKYDYVVYHYYPEFYPHISDDYLLAAPISGPFAVKKLVSNIRSRLVATGKCSGSCSSFPISISEWNSVSHNPTPQTFTIVEGLFTAETLGEFFNAGITRAEFWVDYGCQVDTPGASGYNGEPPASVYGWQQGTGAQGLTAVDGIPDPKLCPNASFSVPPGTILPSGRAMQLYAQSGFATEGASAVALDSSSPTVRSYASYNRQTNRYVIIVINVDGSNSATVRLSIDGMNGGSAYHMIQYSKEIYDATRNNGPWKPSITRSFGPWTFPLAVVVPPWSMTAYTLDAR